MSVLSEFLSLEMGEAIVAVVGSQTVGVGFSIVERILCGVQLCVTYLCVFASFPNWCAILGSAVAECERQCPQSSFDERLCLLR